VAQQHAIYAVLSARDAGTQLVVLPTAGGKTATFIVLAIAEAAAAVTVTRRLQVVAKVAPSAVTTTPTPWYPPVTIVLTPTRAITANIVGAARAAGLTVGSRPCGCDAGKESLFVIAMGTAVRDGVVFREVTRRLSDGGRLARVVIDEAHLTLLWDFREALAHLRATVVDLPCPLLLLTATAPPAWIEALLAAVGLRAHRP